MADIIHEFTVKAPRERVFQAFATPEGLDSWWTPCEREHYGNVLHQDCCRRCEIRNGEAGKQHPCGTRNSLNGHPSDTKRELHHRIHCGELS